MNSFQRSKFLKKIEAKYSCAVEQQSGYNVITLKDVTDVVVSLGFLLIPGTYEIEYPTTQDGASPWGPTITFKFKITSPKQESVFSTGDPKIGSTIQIQFMKKLGSFIYAVSTEYEGNGTYKTTITEKASAKEKPYSD